MYEYKVVQVREGLIGGKLSADKLERVLNEHARQGWQLKALTAADVTHRPTTRRGGFTVRTQSQQQTAPDHGPASDRPRPLGTLANPRRIRWATREERAGR